MIQFKDRSDAGKQLALHLTQFKNKPNVIVLALPRGGVVVAYEVAQALGLPLDVIITRKIGVPMQLELAAGALTEQGIPVWNEDVKRMLGLTLMDLAPIIDEEKKEIVRRIFMYRGDEKILDLTGKTVILVDDGIATGATMRAAIASARASGAAKVDVAVPLSSPDALVTIAREADETWCLNAPELFPAIGLFYQDFSQVSDEEVITLLHKKEL